MFHVFFTHPFSHETELPEVLGKVKFTPNAINHSDTRCQEELKKHFFWDFNSRKNHCKVEESVRSVENHNVKNWENQNYWKLSENFEV